MKCTQMKALDLQGTTYACDGENMKSRKEYVDYFKNQKEWLNELSKDSRTYLIRQMARFILMEIGMCLTCERWKQTDDGIAGQYKSMPASGRCLKKNIQTYENEKCEDYEES